MKIVLGGREFTLVRPKGRAGRKFVARTQGILSAVAPLFDLMELESPGRDAFEEMSIAVRKLWFDEDLKLEEELLPDILRFTEESLSRKDALDFLDSIDDSPYDIIAQLGSAFTFYVSPPGEDMEALEEASKKSKTGEKKEE